MNFADYTTLRDQVQAVAAQDVHLGAVLSSMLDHLAQACGLDVAAEEAKAAAAQAEAMPAPAEAPVTPEAPLAPAGEGA